MGRRGRTDLFQTLGYVRHIINEVAVSSESLAHPVIAALSREGQHRELQGRISVDRLHVLREESAVDAAVVHNYSNHRQAVAGDGLQLHSGEAKGTVSLDIEHLEHVEFRKLGGKNLRGWGVVSTPEGGGQCVPKSDSHGSKGSGIKATTREYRRHHGASDVHRIGALVHNDDVVLCEEITNWLVGGIVVQRKRVIFYQTLDDTPGYFVEGKIH